MNCDKNWVKCHRHCQALRNVDFFFIGSVDSRLYKFKWNVFFLWCEKPSNRIYDFKHQEEDKEEICISVLIETQENVEYIKNK